VGNFRTHALQQKASCSITRDYTIGDKLAHDQTATIEGHAGAGHEVECVRGRKDHNPREVVDLTPLRRQYARDLVGWFLQVSEAEEAFPASAR
jgi:hypothetical protein